ncbi:MULTISPECIES: hypothetical protein [Vibrio harveyi group]|uniref:hypothetical protein n=1 Tax=Vibrio harveyi group TaxID=717610 RepID=UPI000971BD02|nr:MULTISPECIES: hypothetical protein [Vibrio harveyi group]APX10092.1 hypothetical protein BWP24_28295 [Vibrio campbellii]ARR10502.1 unknow [Vibrio campbellii]WHP52949.1 hypothetical protein QMY43_25365 [Vibrio parahaemolyticus]
MNIIKRICKEAYRLIYSIMFGRETFNNNHDFFYMDGFMRKKLADKMGSLGGSASGWFRELDYTNVFCFMLALTVNTLGLCFFVLVNVLNPYLWLGLFRFALSFLIMILVGTMLYSFVGIVV